MTRKDGSLWNSATRGTEDPSKHHKNKPLVKSRHFWTNFSELKNTFLKSHEISVTKTKTVFHFPFKGKKHNSFLFAAYYLMNLKPSVTYFIYFLFLHYFFLHRGIRYIRGNNPVIKSLDWLANSAARRLCFGSNHNRFDHRSIVGTIITASVLPSGWCNRCTLEFCRSVCGTVSQQDFFFTYRSNVFQHFVHM